MYSILQLNYKSRLITGTILSNRVLTVEILYYGYFCTKMFLFQFSTHLSHEVKFHVSGPVYMYTVDLM